MKSTPDGGQTATGPSDRFTGTAYIDGIRNSDDQSAVGCALVRFTPGARTTWHTHPRGQTLYITDGIWYVARRGGPRARPPDARVAGRQRPPGGSDVRWPLVPPPGAAAATPRIHRSHVPGTPPGDFVGRTVRPSDPRRAEGVRVYGRSSTDELDACRPVAGSDAGGEAAVGNDGLKVLNVRVAAQVAGAKRRVVRDEDASPCSPDVCLLDFNCLCVGRGDSVFKGDGAGAEHCHVDVEIGQHRGGCRTVGGPCSSLHYATQHQDGGAGSAGEDRSDGDAARHHAERLLVGQ